MRVHSRVRSVSKGLFYTALVSAAVALLPGRPAEAQPIELPGIFIEGATLAAPPPTAPSGPAGPADGVGGIPAREIGSAVTVVTGEQLRAQQIRNAADALRGLPGVSVSQTGGGAGLTQIRIRGAEANHTLVLIDGIDASDPSGNEFDWSNLLAEDIERIEVIRGAQSGIYGSKAIGGVINIITKGGQGPLTLTARAEAGGYGTSDVAARASGGTDRFWLSVGANYREQNDFNWDPWGSEDDSWRHSTFQVKGGVTLMQGMMLDFFARRSDRFAHTDADFFAPRPQTPFSSAIDTPDTADQQTFLGGVNLRWDMLGGALTHVVKANRNDSDLESFTFGSVSTNDSVVDTLSYLATYRFEASQLLQSKHSISGFIEKKDEEFTPTSLFTDGLTRKRGHVATVAEYRVGFYDRLFVGGSIRRDDNDEFADFTTWNVNASLNIPEIGLRPHASTGTGVALPGMFEQFGSILGTFVGNPNLVPEESESWDAGVEFTLLGGRALLDVTYFNANLTNEIDGFGNTLFNQFGESKRSGVEVAGRIVVLPGVSLGGSYTYLDATEPNGQQEDRRPKHTGRADLNYSFDAGRGNLNVAAIYNGANPYVDLVSFDLVTLDPYWLVNVAASYRLTPEWEVFGRVENALDERYEELLGYNTLGLTAYAGVKFTYTATGGASGR